MILANNFLCKLEGIRLPMWNDTFMSVLDVQNDSDMFHVEPRDMEGVYYAVNGKGLEVTADQAEAFGIALIAAAYKSRAMEKQNTLNWPMEGHPFPNAIFE